MSVEMEAVHSVLASCQLSLSVSRPAVSDFCVRAEIAEAIYSRGCNQVRNLMEVCAVLETVRMLGVDISEDILKSCGELIREYGSFLANEVEPILEAAAAAEEEETPN